MALLLIAFLRISINNLIDFLYWLSISSVLIKQLSAWFILEDSFDKICLFLGKSFGKSLTVLVSCSGKRLY
jgi:hypothetical protein